jgi:uncharacterized protein
MSAAKAAKQLLDGFATGDVESTLAALDPELELAHSDALPWGGMWRGHAGFQGFIGKMLERFEVEVLGYELFDAGDVATSRIMTRFTSRANGESVEMPVVELYWARGGKLYRIEPYYQNQTIVAEMYARAGAA